ncbi:hypothetical protein M404DRAFT_803183 [Pisolithus tinctorius Marx 270]|uniref:Uncharacterized protein n=1 Tax=Pisolithus tinctorius Marx 270 TaxID=870435 RepID=A0A0C3PDN7_PISTI|nr:hypothetical protein M404DRAFT_803183 [Pisolithus tinctorius Marx 270]
MAPVEILRFRLTRHSNIGFTGCIAETVEPIHEGSQCISAALLQHRSSSMNQVSQYHRVLVGGKRVSLTAYCEFSIIVSPLI